LTWIFGLLDHLDPVLVSSKVKVIGQSSRSQGENFFRLWMHITRWCIHYQSLEGSTKRARNIQIIGCLC